MDFLETAIAELSATPQRVEEIIAGLNDEQLSWKPTEFFSMRESVLHLRDIDVYGYEKRLRFLLTEDYPVFEDIDGAKLAIERKYSEQPILPALEDWKRSRAVSMQRLRGTSLLDLDRRAEMQGAGPIDLRRLLELWMEHDRGHIAELLEQRRALESGSGPQLQQHRVA